MSAAAAPAAGLRRWTRGSDRHVDCHGASLPEPGGARAGPTAASAAACPGVALQHHANRGAVHRDSLRRRERYLARCIRDRTSTARRLRAACRCHGA